MFNTLHTAPIAGTWSGYESTQWLNPPTAPPKLTKKGNSIWITRILASIFSVYLKLKYYLMACMYQSEKEIGSLSISKISLFRL
jgi:hypothetical protein